MELSIEQYDAISCDGTTDITCVSHFGRTRRDGDIDIFAVSGERETRLENITGVYPIGSQFSCAYEHAGGIVLSRKDAEMLGLSIDED